jgi:hypothetical protein
MFPVKQHVGDKSPFARKRKNDYIPNSTFFSRTQIILCVKLSFCHQHAKVLGTWEQGYNMSKIEFYDDEELEGLTEEQLHHLRLVSRVLSRDKYAHADWLESLTNQELLEILQENEEPEKPKPIKRPKPEEPKKPLVIQPRTMREAFLLVDGRLMRRTVAMVQEMDRNGKYWKQVEHLVLCGERAKWNGRTYYSSIVMHYLKTGELVSRVPNEPVAPRYRARVRNNGKLVHLGYFASLEERDAAVFAYNLGIFNPMDKIF